METAAAFERHTKVPNVLRKSETVDNVPTPQRRWHAVDIFQTVIVQEEKPQTLSDSFDFHRPAVSASIVTPSLKKIARPFLIALSYEPHARKEILELLATRMSELRQTLGQPGVATAVARLRADLKRGYEAATPRDDMANFASVISLLQDYCYMHWSKMSADQLTRIENTLIGMRKKTEILPKDISQLARVLREQDRSIDYPSTDQLYLDDEELSDEDKDRED